MRRPSSGRSRPWTGSVPGEWRQSGPSVRCSVVHMLGAMSALAQRQMRVTCRRDAIEPLLETADVSANWTQEALGIDAHPEDSDSDRGEQPPFARVEVFHLGRLRR